MIVINHFWAELLGVLSSHLIKFSSLLLYFSLLFDSFVWWFYFWFNFSETGVERAFWVWTIQWRNEPISMIGEKRRKRLTVHGQPLIQILSLWKGDSQPKISASKGSFCIFFELVLLGSLWDVLLGLKCLVLVFAIPFWWLIGFLWDSNPGGLGGQRVDLKSEEEGGGGRGRGRTNNPRKLMVVFGGDLKEIQRSKGRREKEEGGGRWEGNAKADGMGKPDERTGRVA